MSVGTSRRLHRPKCRPCILSNARRGRLQGGKVPEDDRPIVEAIWPSVVEASSGTVPVVPPVVDCLSRRPWTLRQSKTRAGIGLNLVVRPWAIESLACSECVGARASQLWNQERSELFSSGGPGQSKRLDDVALCDRRSPDELKQRRLCSAQPG